MRAAVITTAIALTVASTGCFTLTGAVIGSAASGSGKKPAPSPRTQSGPPGAFVFTDDTPEAPPPTGMSPVGKGALIGLVLDAALAVAFVVELSSWERAH
jgi:hypothetical protein